VFAANSVRGIIPVLSLSADQYAGPARHTTGEPARRWSPGRVGRSALAALAIDVNDGTASRSAVAPAPQPPPPRPSRSRAQPGILLIDNYDSFTYNLVHLVRACGASVEVVRNDEVTAEQVADLDPDGLLLSPGPCAPPEAGVCLSAVQRLGGSTPILGVCLGHQVIAAAYGALITRTGPVHGRTSAIVHDGQGVLYGVPPRFEATRYHSLLVDERTLPTALRVTARSSDGLVMALRHVEAPVEGLQFHPESVLTTWGPTLIANFVRCAAQRDRPRPARGAPRGAGRSDRISR
jgi:anthranilate synthase/aminodeoxychorismate synthase-like glutamine amidotransferase